MAKTVIVGVVGAAGNLGGRLSVQASSTFRLVYTYDIAKSQSSAQTGVDPSLKAGSVSKTPKSAATLSKIFENCDVIHWAAPVDSVKTVPRLPRTSLLVLHDSVMSNSVEAARELTKREEIAGQIGVAHCLMNKNGTVVVANDFGETKRLAQHITDLGLHLELLRYEEHDHLMAHSQGLWAIICRLLRAELEEYEGRNLLTPSSERFLTAMLDNESFWTEASYNTVVSNPQLESVVETIHKKVKNGQHR